ncbi:MAG TPA: sodium-coupled permease [Verrucomicrobiae bacterium]|nr:sodium-coupled permease [Verrucomicrobiae bacterium]
MAAHSVGTHRAGLRALDWAVIGLYAATLVFIGWRASRKHSTTHDYFIGRSGFGSFTIGISMFVTLFSTISYLSGPGEVIRYGPGVYFGLLISVPFAFPLIAYWLLPTLMKRRVLSLYQLFEYTLGPRIRTLGACMFLVYRTVWMGVLLHFASEALSVIFGVGPAWIPVITIATGAIVIIYTSLGGLRAVITADVLQFFVLFIGALASIAVVTIWFGGFQWFPTKWNPAWPKQPVFSTDLTVRLTWVGVALQIILVNVAHGVDQTQVQRYMASAELPRARRAVLTRLLGEAAVWTLLAPLGLALVSFYQRFPGSMPEGQTIQTYADQLFPFFIAHELPVGLSGLVVAGILAAGMSSIDSGINAFTAVVLNDFVDRRGVRQKTDAEHKRFAMLLAVAIGVCVVTFSLFVGWVPGNYYEIAARTIRLFIPLELGVVLLALFVRFATPFGVVWGIIYGFVLGVLISYWTSFTGRTGISFTLYVPCILMIQMITSCLFSFIPARRFSRSQVLLTSALLAAVLAAVVIVALRSC